MIQPFHIADLGCFLPNEFSDPDRVLNELRDADFTVQTLWDGDMVAAILVFKEYHPGNWFGFFLVSEYITPRMAVMLKRHILATMEEKDALRLHTHSQHCDKLSAWHKFLGFKREGLHEKFLHGKDYCTWALMRHRGQ